MMSEVKSLLREFALYLAIQNNLPNFHVKTLHLNHNHCIRLIQCLTAITWPNQRYSSQMLDQYSWEFCALTRNS